MILSSYIRELTVEYITQDFLDTLAALRPTDLTVDEAKDLFHIHMTSLGREKPDIWVVVEDVIEPDGSVKNKVVGTASLLIERKFIRRGGVCGHIEDVAIHPDHQRKGHAKRLMERLIGIAKFRGCYKVILDCNDELIPFYRQFGFKESERHMRLDFHSEPKDF